MTEQPFTPPQPSSEHPHEEHTDTGLGQLLEFPGARRTEATETPQPATTTEDQPAGDTEDEPGSDVATRPETGGEVALPADAPTNRRLAERAKTTAQRAKQAARTAGHKSAPAAKGVVRHSYWLTAGGFDMAAESYKKLTARDIDEQIRAARAAGDYGTVAQLLHQRTQDRKLLMERLQVFGKGLLWTPVVAGGAAVTTLAVTLVVSIFAVCRPGGMGFADVWTGFADAIVAGWEWTVWAGGMLPWVGAVALAGVVLTGYNRRRSAGEAPQWAQSTGAVRESEPITPSLVVVALRDLGVTALKQAVRDSADAGAEFVGNITLAGCGVEVTVYLPRQVSTKEIKAKRAQLAENLGRHEHELFISTSEKARSVDLWIADPGALDEPIGPSPLETDPEITADYYTGRAPWGQSLRGDQVAVSLKQMHLLLTGLSNQGKTAALRSLLLWLLLDKSVELHLADLKGIGDWHMFSGIATTLIEGPSDAHVVRATEMLEWGVTEMHRRLAAHDAEKHPDGVPADLARKPGSGFHPLVFVVDEAQVAYMCPEVDENKVPYGGQKNTSRFLRAVREIQNQGRAVNVVLWQGTQDPTNQNLPKLAREGAHIRGSLAVGTESQAGMAVGEKAVNGGAAPHKLRQGKDKGTVVVTGDGVPLPEGEVAMTVRTYYVNGETARQLADRIRAERGEVTTDEPTGPTTGRDLLEDLDAVLGAEAMHAVHAASHLKEIDAHAKEYYADLNGKALADRLETEYELKVPNSGQKRPIDPAAVRAKLAEQRAAADEGDGGGNGA